MNDKKLTTNEKIQLKIDEMLENDIYNSQTKERFLDNYKTTSRRIVAQMFKKAAEIEKYYEKDIYDMNLDELEEVMYNFSSKSLGTLTSNLAILRKYIDFAMQNRLTNATINYAKLIKNDEVVRYTNKMMQKKSYFTKEEIYDDVQDLENAIDKAIVVLLFMGIDVDNLLKLKKTDFNYINGTLQVGEKTLTLDNETTEIIRDAISQEYYYSQKFDEQRESAPRKYQLEESEYIVRGSIRTERRLKENVVTDGSNKVNKRTVTFRFTRIQEATGKMYTINNVFGSGLIHCAREYKKENGIKKLTGEDITNINELFGLDATSVRNFYTKNKIERFI